MGPHFDLADDQVVINRIINMKLKGREEEDEGATATVGEKAIPWHEFLLVMGVDGVAKTEDVECISY